MNCCTGSTEFRVAVSLAPSVSDGVSQFLATNEFNGEPLRIARLPDGAPFTRDVSHMRRTMEGHADAEPVAEPWWAGSR